MVLEFWGLGIDNNVPVPVKEQTFLINLNFVQKFKDLKENDYKTNSSNYYRNKVYCSKSTNIFKHFLRTLI